MMQNKTMLALFSLLLAFCLAGCSAASSSVPPAPAGTPEPLSSIPEMDKTVVRIAGMKGPTTMGMVGLMQRSENGETAHDYQVTMAGTADEIVPLLSLGELDVAAVPCNLAAVLYNRLEGEVQMAAINTLGVLYIVETGDSVHTVDDLRGKTIYSTGRGTTPEFTLSYILRQNGLDPEKDVTIEFKSEATEVANLLMEGSVSDAVALLPQPYVTTVQAKLPELRVALDMTAEWAKASDGESALVTGVLLARRAFIEEHPGVFGDFLDDYRASTEFVRTSPDAAAALVARYGIVPAEAVAKKAIPQCNITFVEGEEMQRMTEGYLKVLFEQNPASVGGKLPDDAFYYKR